MTPILCAASLLAATAFALVRDGAAVAEILSTADGLVSADIDYFTNALSRATGARVPVVTRPSGSRPVMAFRVEPRALLEEDAWRVEFEGARRMTVVGSRMSCRWAINRILEEKCGLVACQPGPRGTYFGKAATVAFAPDAGLRGDADWKIERHLWREDAQWERALGGKRHHAMNGDLAIGHSFYLLLPPEKYAKDPWREQVMPEHDGVRIVPKVSNCFWQPCFASPVTLRETVKNVDAYLASHPGMRLVPVTGTDGEGYCRCKACETMNGGWGRKCRFLPSHEDHSVSYYKFVNLVAREVARRHPGVLVGTSAYLGWVDPPPFRLEDNVVVTVCEDIYQSDCEAVRRRMEEKIAAWSEKAKYIGTYDYSYSVDLYWLPRMISRNISAAFARKLKYPALNLFNAESTPYGLDWVKRWFMYRCLVDSSCDRETELRRWYRAAVGEKAAPALEAYFELWESFWTGEAMRKTKWYRKWIGWAYMEINDPSWTEAVDRETCRKADELMGRVHAAALASGDADQRYRAQMMKLYHESGMGRLALTGRWHDPKGEGLKTPADAIRFAKGDDGEYWRQFLRLQDVTDEIVADMERYPRYAADARDARRWSGLVSRFRSLSLSNDAFTRRTLAGLCNWSGDPSVRAAYGAAAKDARVPDYFKGLFRGLAGIWEPGAATETRKALRRRDYSVRPSETDGGAGTLTAEKTGWCGTTIDYPASCAQWNLVKVTVSLPGAAKAPAVVSTGLKTLHGSGYGWACSRATVAPGETKSLVSAAYSVASGEIQLYFDVARLEKGEQVCLERVEFADARAFAAGLGSGTSPAAFSACSSGPCRSARGRRR